MGFQSSRKFVYGRVPRAEINSKTGTVPPALLYLVCDASQAVDAERNVHLLWLSFAFSLGKMKSLGITPEQGWVVLGVQKVVADVSTPLKIFK
jgi:hypothetical protein